jgi:hypothetical protein
MNYKALIKKVQYKPGWKFKVTHSPEHRLVFLDVTMPVPNRDNPQEIIPVFARHVLSSDVDTLPAHAFWHAVRRTLHDMETHESDEMLLIDGKRRFDPHA